MVIRLTLSCTVCVYFLLILWPWVKVKGQQTDTHLSSSWEFMIIELNIAQYNWYVWITCNFGYIHTKFHLDQTSGLWDMWTVEFYLLLLLWSWVKVKSHQKWHTLVALTESHNHTKFEETRKHSLWKSPNVTVSVRFQCASIIFPWLQISQSKLMCTCSPHGSLWSYKVGRNSVPQSSKNSQR